MAKDKNKKNNEADKKGAINLLPEDLREREEKALKSKSNKRQVELRKPKGVKPVKEKKERLPWFSFWTKKDKVKSSPEPDKSKPDKPEKVKLKLKILKKHKEEAQALEDAKEEVAKKDIISSVFGDKAASVDLPKHDYSLVNKPSTLPEGVDDMFDPQDIKASASPAKDSKFEERPPQALAESADPADPDLPSAPALKEIPTEPQPKPEVEVMEPITPDLPAKSGAGTAPASVVDPVKPDIKKTERPKKKLFKNLFHKPSKAGDGGLKGGDGDDGGLGVNLIPSSLTMKSWKRIVKNFILILIVSLIFEGLAYGALEVWEQQTENQTTEIDAEIKSVRDRIITFNSLQDEIYEVEAQIDSVTDLLERHIYWTQFFELLEKYTLDDVYFEGFSAGINGNLNLSAHGPDFASAARQLELLRKDEAKEFVAGVSITQVSDTGSIAGKTFSIDLVLNNDLFYYSEISNSETSR